MILILRADSVLTLAGHIPPEVGKLTALMTLNLAGNQLSGEAQDHVLDCVVKVDILTA